MTKSQLRVQRIIAALLAADWKCDGHIQSDTVRVPTQRSPVLGGIGGEVRTFGGRQRFKKGSRKVTVGLRVVCFYTVTDGQAHNMVRLSTREEDSIIAEASRND